MVLLFGKIDLYLAKCLAQRSHSKCCKMVQWAEVVTMWQEPVYFSNYTYRWPKNMGANGRLTLAKIFIANKKYKGFIA